jgi:osmotically-inducible protein OsmY
MITNGKSGVVGAGAAEPRPAAPMLSRDFLAEYIWQQSQQMAYGPVDFPGQIEAQLMLYREAALRALWWMGNGGAYRGQMHYARTPIAAGGRMQYAPTHYGAGYASLGDEELAAALSEAFETHSATMYAEIDIDVRDQIVALSGKAPNRFAKRAAELLAWSFPGVRDVDDRIEVRSRIRRR